MLEENDTRQSCIEGGIIGGKKEKGKRTTEKNKTFLETN